MAPRRFTDDELLDALRAAHAHIDAPMYPRGYVVWYRHRHASGDRDVPSYTIYSQRWGSLRTACTVAGVPHRSPPTDTPSVAEALDWARRARRDVVGPLTIATYREWQRRQRRAGVPAPLAHVLIGRYGPRPADHDRRITNDLIRWHLAPGA